MPWKQRIESTTATVVMRGRARSTIPLRVIAALCTAFALPMAAGQGIPEQDQFSDKLMRLGAGPMGGSFAPIAAEICDTLNQHRRASLVRCVTVASAGSVFNIHAVANGNLQLGFGQEDLVAKAATDARLKSGASLRVVAVMHDSPIGIMVRADAGITDLRDIRRATLNLGVQGSGIQANSDEVLRALGIDEKELKGVVRLSPSEAVKAFCEGRINLIVNAIAQPSAQYAELRGCGGEFLDIPESVMKVMKERNPWLRPMSIPAGLYDTRQREATTLGMRNLLVTHASVDPEAIRRVAKRVALDLGGMRKAQPLMVSVRPTDAAATQRLPVPMHPGALVAMQETTP